MTKVLKTRAAYVIYVPAKGFVKNKSGEFHKEFEHARIFPTDKAANSSVDMNRKLKKFGKDEPVFIIPVEMNVDPRKLFKTVLKGEQ